MLKRKEIEALLALDGSRLTVACRTDKKLPEWIYVITTKNGEHFARQTSSKTRTNEALNEVWGVYQRYMSSDNKQDMFWLYEFAMGDVEARLIQSLKPTKAPKWAEDITGEEDGRSQDQ